MKELDDPYSKCMLYDCNDDEGEWTMTAHWAKSAVSPDETEIPVIAISFWYSEADSYNDDYMILLDNPEVIVPGSQLRIRLSPF